MNLPGYNDQLVPNEFSQHWSELLTWTEIGRGDIRASVDECDGISGIIIVFDPDDEDAPYYAYLEFDSEGEDRTGFFGKDLFQTSAPTQDQCKAKLTALLKTTNDPTRL